MENPNNNQLVTDVARDLLAEIAPEEKPLLRAISESYFKNPDQTMGARTGRGRIHNNEGDHSGKGKNS